MGKIVIVGIERKMTLSKKIYQKKRTKANSIVWDKFSKDHKIFKMYGRKNPNLDLLKKNEEVVYGNGKNYYYLLVKKTKSINH